LRPVPPMSTASVRGPTTVIVAAAAAGCDAAGYDGFLTTVTRAW
jgi:hypothetical protein